MFGGKKDSKRKKVGGISFYLSLFFLSLLSVINVLSLPFLISAEGSKRAAIFLLATFLGFNTIPFIVKGHLSVFIHEAKHSIVSGFVGNRPKAMVVRSDSGEFKYEYTKDTARYNALIALAPYILPLFSLLLMGFSYSLVSTTISFAHAAITGVGYGADLKLNLRDVSDRQTDIIDIRGGYRVGIAYITAANIWIATLFLAWTFGGFAGMVGLVKGWAIVLFKLAGGREIPSFLLTEGL